MKKQNKEKDGLEESSFNEIQHERKILPVIRASKSKGRMIF